ncbi:ankyrin [Melanomma pulvis-pyrius CBS 109.77]|uniref:Ankyrin n=1 Tax=Melanomma pulvis-pyrius CBS 109.77 TaxID=1314802 RepID=A0A6A6XET8_9PLEO|nr:ankyrin [Melanomma pulvis-pyrius CBS 109.77]
MPFPHRIEKRPSSARLGSKRGRGRPSDWSSTWQKKLIVLRLCGLQLNEILQLFNVLGDGVFIAKERRAQQLLRKILYTGYTRYCAPNKDVLRKRITFLRSLGNHNQLQRAMKHVSQSGSLKAHALVQSTERTISNQSNPALEILESPTSTVDDLEHNGSPPNTGVNPPGQRTLVAPKKTARTLSILRTPSSAPEPIQEYPCLGKLISDDARSAVSSRSAKIRSILKRASYSSSLISEIQSVLNMRFSLSTLASSRRCSVSVSSTTDSEGVRHLDPPEMKTGRSPSTVLELHQQKALQANAALITMCCSNTPGCVHRYIGDAAKAIIQRARAEEQFNAEQQAKRVIPDEVLNRAISCKAQAEAAVTSLRVFLSDCPIPNGELTLDDPKLCQINDPDVYGNTTLFFAARSGAPIEILIDILRHVVDVNALNDDGQTFLFLLDLDGVSLKRCCCIAPLMLSHSSEFECLIRQLEARCFDFDHIDHNGRHFLSYLCASTPFKGDCLIDLAEKDLGWKERLQSLSWVRDSSGSFLQDFLGLNVNNGVLARLDVNNEGLTKYISEQFSPPFIQDPLSENDGKRRTAFHEYIRGEEFLRTTSLLSELIRQNKLVYGPGYLRENINKYDELGHTPIMDFLDRAVGGRLDEESIVAKTRDLVAFGANINARARDGSTLLHIVAKKSCPELLQYVLSVGVQANCRDEAGLTALDYVAESLTRSRTSSAPASLTARSLKAAIPLLDYASRGMLDNVASSILERMEKREVQKSAKACSAFEVMVRHSGFQTQWEACTNNVAL